MTDPIDRLFARAKLAPLGDNTNCDASSRILDSRLCDLYKKCDGLFAFNECLQVFPARQQSILDLSTWNSATGWRKHYDAHLSGATVFFGQDALANQFGVDDAGFFILYTESGEQERMGATLAEWADCLLRDWHGWTAYELGNSWQKRYGPLKFGERLTPIVPFVLGGNQIASNLRREEVEKILEFRADILAQIRGLPDGTPIKLDVSLDQ